MKWLYIQDLVIPEEMVEDNDEDDLEEELAIVAELDCSALVNNGELLSAKALAANWDLANMGCIREMAQDLPGGCRDNYFALTHIEAGEEILCNYGSFAYLDAELWHEFGLVCDEKKC